MAYTKRSGPVQPQVLDPSVVELHLNLHKGALWVGSDPGRDAATGDCLAMPHLSLWDQGTGAFTRAHTKSCHGIPGRLGLPLPTRERTFGGVCNIPSTGRSGTLVSLLWLLLAGITTLTRYLQGREAEGGRQAQNSSHPTFQTSQEAHHSKGRRASSGLAWQY